jgi:DNA-directed RNA polymerase specialized sigma24 family protein
VQDESGSVSILPPAEPDEINLKAIRLIATIQRLSRESRARFWELVELYEGMLPGFLFNQARAREVYLEKKDLEDICIEVWLRVWNFLTSRQPFREENPGGWVCEIARNYLIDWIKANKRQPKQLTGNEEQLPISAEPPPFARVEQLPIEEQWQRFVGALEEIQAALEQLLPALPPQNVKAGPGRPSQEVRLRKALGDLLPHLKKINGYM